MKNLRMWIDVDPFTHYDYRKPAAGHCFNERCVMPVTFPGRADR